MAQEDIKEIVDFGLSIIEGNPEALLEPLQQEGPEQAIPAFVASTIQKVLEGDPNIELQDVLAGIIGLFTEIGEVLLKAGIELPKEQIMQLLSETVELSLQMSPSLHEAANQMAQDADAKGEFDELKAEGQPTEPQGVL